MGEQKGGKYHVSDEGKVFRVNDDGSFTEVGNVKDINSNHHPDKDSSFSNSQEISHKPDEDNSKKENKGINQESNHSKKISPWLIISVLALCAIFVLVLVYTYPTSKVEEPAPWVENTFINTQPFPADTTNLEVVWVNKIPIYLRHIKGGDFKGRIQTDSVDGQKSWVPDDEWEQFDMSVNDFTIALTEVTQELWQEVMNEPFSQYLRRISQDSEEEYQDYGIGDKLPVYCIDIGDAKNFIEKLNHLTGKHFRLPTSKEWVYAQMGGTNTVKISGREAIDKVAWVYKNANWQHHEVATKLPNNLGLYDMIGNVEEWTTMREDEYDNGNNYPYDYELDENDNCFLQDCWRVSGRPHQVGFRLVLE